MAAICFLITGDIPVGKIWNLWLSNGNFNKFAHVSRGSEKCKEWLVSNNIKTVDEVNTSWGAPSIATAMYNLYNAAFDTNEYCILVSQDTIPLLSCAELSDFLESKKISYLDNIDKFWWDNNKIEAQLVQKYDKAIVASQFGILHKDAWLIIKDKWHTYFNEFSTIYNKEYASKFAYYCMDEIFIPSMISMFDIPVIYRNIIHAEYDETDHGVFINISKLDELILSKKYIMSRKYKDSPELIQKLCLFDILPTLCDK